MMTRSAIATMCGSAICAGVLGLSACSLDKLVRVDDPDQVQTVGPDQVKSVLGATGMYYTAVQSLANSLTAVSFDVARLSDEATYVTTTSFSDSYMDARVSRDGTGIRSGLTDSFGKLQATRIGASQAIELLRTYGPPSSHARIGHAYAIKAHATVLLTELFCSGVPLTEAPFERDLIYTRGFSTEEMLQHAVALFDTAYTYAQDSADIATFIRVGKGRALLGLGEYTAAAQAVAAVPTSARYVVQFTSILGGVSFWTAAHNTSVRMLNAEGTNGLDWIASSVAQQDPRVPTTTSGGVVRQNRFAATGTLDFVAASGIEARLIEAEAALQAGEIATWVSILNTLRATGGAHRVPSIGAIPALPADSTTAPTVTTTLRENVMFRERAFWLYLTGTRLNDMRRLVRQYNRLPAQVYTSGAYLSANTLILTYGNEMVLTPPVQEQDRNPLYDGCINRNP